MRTKSGMLAVLLTEVRQQRQEQSTQTDAPASSDPLGEIQQRCRQARDECLQQGYLKSLLKTRWADPTRVAEKSYVQLGSPIRRAGGARAFLRREVHEAASRASRADHQPEGA